MSQPTKPGPAAATASPPPSPAAAKRTHLPQPAQPGIILMTPYPIEPGHTLITIVRLNSETEWKPEMRQNASFVAEGDNAGIVINKPSSIMDYNRSQAAQKERLQPPSAKMSFKVFLISSETGKVTLEHRTLRFWLNHEAAPLGNGSINDSIDMSFKSTRTFSNIRQESSQVAQTYFCQLIGTKPNDDFPKSYVAFIMKLMRLLKMEQFSRIARMEVELRQLPQEEYTKPPSRASSIDGSQGSEGGGRVSPLTSQRVLDIIESSYPNPISVREICSATQTEELIVKQFVDELAQREKINTTDDGQHFVRTLKSTTDTKINLVKQMPKVINSQQPVIAIITAQYCEKLAVDSMISDKETFVRYRTSNIGNTNTNQSNDAMSTELSSANYVYTLGNIGDHRVVSTKLTSVGHSRGALIAAGNATTRLLGIFPGIEYVFLVGCSGGVPNYSDFSTHVRLGDVVISHLPDSEQIDSEALLNDPNCSHKGGSQLGGTVGSVVSQADYIYVHCRPKLQEKRAGAGSSSLSSSHSVHKGLKLLNGNNLADRLQEQQAKIPESPEEARAAAQSKASLDYEDCHFRLWRPALLDLQQLAQRLWIRGLENPQNRIWEYYIDEGIKSLRSQEIEAERPIAETDKLFMSIGPKDTIEVSHPEANEDDVDLRKEGRPMCHFGPVGSGKPVLANEPLRQRMISEFGIRAFDSEFDPVVESIHGNCKENYIMIRGISDYCDGRKKKEWQQYSALIAAAFMKSIIVNLQPLN